MKASAVYLTIIDEKGDITNRRVTSTNIEEIIDTMKESVVCEIDKVDIPHKFGKSIELVVGEIVNEMTYKEFIEYTTTDSHKLIYNKFRKAFSADVYKEIKIQKTSMHCKELSKELMNDISRVISGALTFKNLNWTEYSKLRLIELRLAYKQARARDVEKDKLSDMQLYKINNLLKEWK